MVHQGRTLAALSEISRYISSSLDYLKIASQCLASLRENLDLEKCGLFMYRKETHSLNLQAGSEWESQELKDACSRFIQGPVRQILVSGMPIAVHDVRDISGLYIPQQYKKTEILGFIGVPLLWDRVPIGMLLAYKTSNRTMIDEDVNVMKIVVSILSQTIKIADLVESTNQKLKMENEELHAELEGKFRVTNLVNSSTAMNSTLEMVNKVANTDALVLLRGESGTGKTLIAKGIHYGSIRRKKPFVVVNCAAIPPSLLESELFGHEKGSFTGATTMRVGKFESATGGTLFLDEIGEIPLEIQSKILRLIQEKSFEKLGSNASQQCDVRIICATNNNLERAVKNRKFREDLYYRLMVVPVYIPPLRSRKEDVLPLSSYFLNHFNDKYQKRVTLSKQAFLFLENYSWPGNVRELEHTIERAVLLSTHGELAARDIPLLNPLDIPVDNEEVPPNLSSVDRNRTRAPYERVPLREQGIRKALYDSVGIQTLAARNLGVSLRQLRYAIKKFGISVIEFKETSSQLSEVN